MFMKDFHYLCKLCGKEFKSYNHFPKYCSISCKRDAWRTLIRNKEFRKKYDIGFKKGHPSWLKGTHIQTNTGKSHFKKGQKVPKGSNSHAWGGGKHIKDGYIMILNPSFKTGTPADERRYIFEHRAIMEKTLGRRLGYQEIVHHKNGIKTDNRLENLELVLRKTHFGQVTCPHCLKSFSIK